jgi:2-oxoglutarate ferredoxin oxidoreductase subunit beta
MLATIEGATLIARASVDSPKNLIRTRALIEKAFRYQMEGKGFSLIEILSPCPTDWGLSPTDALQWIRDHMMTAFPLGVFKDRYGSDD